MLQRSISAALLLVSLAGAQPPVDSLLKSIQDNITISTDVRAQVNMTQQKPGQGTKLFDMLYFRRDKDDAFLIVFDGPESEKGNGYLRVEDNFWMYRQNTRTFQHINRDESIGGTDAKGEDFETRRLNELYGPVKDSLGHEAIHEEMLGPYPVWRFDVKAKVIDVSYPYRTSN